MNVNDKTKTVIKIVWCSVWLAAALLFWSVGLYGTFCRGPIIGSIGFFNWFAWGMMCTPFILKFFVGYVLNAARSSAAKGSRSYTIHSNGRVTNNSFQSGVLGFIIGIAVGIFAGPIVLPINAYHKIKELVSNIKHLDKKENM